MSDTHSVQPNIYRTHTNGDLRVEHAGQEVTLSGWVHSRRDHGGLIFIDLRDRYGITQLTINPSTGSSDMFKVAEQIRDEYVIQVTGTVKERPSEMVNAALPTGEIEVEVTKLDILNAAETPPFEVASETPVNEELRFKYRFIDLRRARMQHIVQMRAQIISHIRQYMSGNGFTEVQTPILANSSPEGARDYLVPSRLHPGKFYALPQAPQQYKQLLMVAGLDRYYQIAPCFRDEDPRADRHSGDFYQIDMEMSFVEQEDVFNIVEPLMIELTEAFTTKKIQSTPFIRLTWHEAMEKYGTDKPDLRYNWEIKNVSDLVKDSGFSVFADAIKNGGVVHALAVPGGAAFSRKDIDDLTEKAKQAGAKGLAYIVVKDDLQSPILKYLGEDTAKAIQEAVGAKSGDIIFFGADSWQKVCTALGAVRSACADKLNVKDSGVAAWCWVIDFPMYEYREEENKIDFSHNPFSMPQGGMKALEEQDPLTLTAFQYDLVLNGYEMTSGAIRNHRPDIMYKAFEIAGYTKEQVDAKFGGLISAFKYGAPPHGGSAVGLDRLIMILLDVESIRDVYAFPKNGKGQDLMMNSPSSVDEASLKDLGLEIDVED